MPLALNSLADGRLLRTKLVMVGFSAQRRVARLGSDRSVRLSSRLEFRLILTTGLEDELDAMRQKLVRFAEASSKPASKGSFSAFKFSVSLMSSPYSPILVASMLRL